VTDAAGELLDDLAVDDGTDHALYFRIDRFWSSRRNVPDSGRSCQKAVEKAELRWNWPL
jgi:hypothetical protein